MAQRTVANGLTEEWTEDSIHRRELRMAIVLEMPASLDSYAGSQDLETGMVQSANEAVDLLESETPADPQETNEGQLETIEPVNEMTDQPNETSTNVNETPPEATEPTPAVNETCQECNCDATDPASIKVEFDPTPRQIAEAEFLRDVRRATDELADATLERLRIEAELKEAKSRCKSAAESLQRLIDRGPQVRNRPPCVMHGNESPTPNQSATQPAPDSIATDTTNSAAASDQTTVAQPVNGDAWREVPLSALQLKPKLQERLEEAGVDTIGRLEDLRAEISQGREKWPKGIGKAKITEIEDAVIAWLSKNRDAQVLAEAQAQAGQDSGADQESPADPQEFDACERAVELDRDNIEELASHHPDGPGCWQSGRDAWNQDAQVSECPYVAGPEADDWIRGWLSASKLDSNSKSQPYREPSIDDL